MSETENSGLKRFGGREWTKAIPSLLDEPNLGPVRLALDNDWRIEICCFPLAHPGRFG